MHFYRLGTLVAGWLGSLLGLVLVLPLGLIVVEWLIFPLALLIAALLAALSAGWAGTYLARDQTQTNLVPVIGITAALGVGLALLFLWLVRMGRANFGPLIVPVLIFSLILALSAAFATWYSRTVQQHRGRALRLTVILLVLALISVPGIVFLAARFGLAGA